jgi:hypothetical protein
MSLKDLGLALTCGMLVASVVYVAALVYHLCRRPRRPYDWTRDGECDNHSRPRVLP